MPIYLAVPVNECAEVSLECWSIREAGTGERYFVGFDVVMRDGRVSTRIDSFDARSRIGLTASGRRYRLLGKAGFDRDAEYVWNKVVAAWQLEKWRDVTPELCPDWRNPIPEAERNSGEPESEARDDPSDHQTERTDR